MPLWRRMSSKRRTPLNTSRRTTNVQRSPRIVIVRPTVQLSADQARAGGAVLMALTLGLVDRLSKVGEAGCVTETQMPDIAALAELDGFAQLEAIFMGGHPGARSPRRSVSVRSAGSPAPSTASWSRRSRPTNPTAPGPGGASPPPRAPPA